MLVAYSHNKTRFYCSKKYSLKVKAYILHIMLNIEHWLGIFSNNWSLGFIFSLYARQYIPVYLLLNDYNDYYFIKCVFYNNISVNYCCCKTNVYSVYFKENSTSCSTKTTSCSSKSKILNGIDHTRRLKKYICENSFYYLTVVLEKIELKFYQPKEINNSCERIYV